MVYEVFIKPGASSRDITAESEQSAKEQFIQLLRDNLE